MEKASRAGDVYAAEKIFKKIGYELIRPRTGSANYIIRKPSGAETKHKNATELFEFLEEEAKHLRILHAIRKY